MILVLRTVKSLMIADSRQTTLERERRKEDFEEDGAKSISTSVDNKSSKEMFHHDSIKDETTTEIDATSAAQHLTLLRQLKSHA